MGIHRLRTFQKCAAVGHAGEHVGGGQALQLALQVLALRHVAVNALHPCEIASMVVQGVAADGDVDHGAVAPHHLARKIRHLAMLHDGGLERVSVSALRVVRLGRAALDFVGLVAQHPAHARAHMLHDALGIGAVVDVLHVLKKATEVLLALAQLGLDLALVGHVQTTHQHGGGSVPFHSHAADEHHAQVALQCADAKFRRFVGPPALFGHSDLLDAVGRAHLVHGMHKIAREAADQAIGAGRFQQRHAGSVGKADGALLRDEHGRWQCVQQTEVVEHRAWR